MALEPGPPGRPNVLHMDAENVAAEEDWDACGVLEPQTTCTAPGCAEWDPLESLELEESAQKIN